MMTFVNPFQKSKCPYYNEQFYPGNCAIVSSRTGTMLRTVRKDFFARAFVPPMNGPYYTGQLAHRQCLHCGNLLSNSFLLCSSLYAWGTF